MGTRQSGFQSINTGYNAVFKPNRLSIGLTVPLDNNMNEAVPSMTNQVERIQLAERLGFKSVWLRDVPFNVPSFGDAGQIYDPFIYLGFLAAQTSTIALGVASIVLPLRHPAHIAKAAASADVLSDGRLILGIASGDRIDEYPAMNMSFDDRDAQFRESFAYIQKMWENTPEFTNHYGSPSGGMDMLPKPSAGKLPLLVTGNSRQHPEWVAQHGDGWITYPRELAVQTQKVQNWRERVEAAGRHPQPVMQPLYIGLMENPDAPPVPIHLGYQTGVNHLRAYLKRIEEIGINHVALNLRFNQANIEDTLIRLAESILPDFS